MSKSLFAIALTVTLTQVAFGQSGYVEGPAFGGGLPGLGIRNPLIRGTPVSYPGPEAGYEVPPQNTPPMNASSGPGMGAYGAGEPFYSYDAYEPWVHGHFQRIPAYGGYHYFKPYNYRHVMPQSQVGAGWGMPPAMPYSQGFYRSREQYYGASTMPYYRADRQFYSRYAPQAEVIPVGSSGRGGYDGR